MSKQLFLLIISAVLLGFTQPSFSQKLWSLNECIEYAHEHNIQIKRQELNSLLSKNYYYESLGQFLPNLNGFFNHSINSGRTG